MKNESLLYLVAAGLFAAAAGIGFGMDGSFGIGEILLLVTAVAMAALAARSKRST